MKVDFDTKSRERGCFARVCVEIDLFITVIDEVWVTDHWHKVEFKSLHLVYSKYKCYGHVAGNCDKELVEEGKDTVVDQQQQLKDQVGWVSQVDLLNP